MRNYDLSPLFRSTIGFDRMGHLIDAALRGDVETPSYPPYNIEKLRTNEYRIIMAVAGFTDDDLEIVQQENTLVIRGKSREKEEAVSYLHRGMAARAFERRFDLAEHITVRAARLENGLLYVDLVHELPEEKRPRIIPVGHVGKAIESKAA